MSEKIIVTLFDRKAEYFLPIWLSDNDQTAKRQFVNLVKESDTLINKNPEDFILFKVGKFDDKSGKVKEIIHHVELANGLFLKNEKIDETLLEKYKPYRKENE